MFNRYVEQIGDRVGALGGNPDEIPPSPSGDFEPHKPPVRHCVTGKVCEVVFDCWGDFEGFILDTCDERVTFKSRERGIQKLVMEALKDRLTITVCVEGKSHRIEKIIVLP